MKAPLDELYLQWLYRQVGSVDTTRKCETYWKLARLLYTTEFVWFVPNDDNRAEDGRNLRAEFSNEVVVDDQDWMRLGCSMFELLLGLSRRLSFETDREARYWFWKLLENIGLLKWNDSRRIPNKLVSSILDAVIWRTYDSSGLGGLFPLTNPSEDQRGVELWYQSSAYLLENGY